MKFELINQQKIKRINFNKIKKYLKNISVLISSEKNPHKIQNLSSKKTSILFCSNKIIKKLNKKFFNRRAATDVIVFPLDDTFDSDYLGEIIISVEEAVKAGKKYGNTWQKEMILYLIHGILHLLGYDDIQTKRRKIMGEKQEKILSELFPNSDEP